MLLLRKKEPLMELKLGASLMGCLKLKRQLGKWKESWLESNLV